MIQQAPPAPPLPPEFFVPGPPTSAIVAVVFLVLAAVVAWPLIRAYARRLERGAGPSADVIEELEHLRRRVNELEPLQGRVAELEDRLDFTERVLAQRAPEMLSRGDER